MATNKINGKMYIGQTICTLKKRISVHVYDTVNKKDNCYFHNAIRKYGTENFEWEVLDSARNIDELNKLEIFLIKLFKTYKDGYNLTVGGRGASGYKHKGYIKKKAYIKKKRYKKGKDHGNYGRVNSEESKLKMSKAKKGMYIGKDNNAARVVIVGSMHFDTRKDAAEFVGVTPQCIRLRILHKTRWLDYYYG